MAQFLARAKRCTPSAWMMLITVPNCVLNPVPNRVLSVGHFIRAQMGHFSLAPRCTLTAPVIASAAKTKAPVKQVNVDATFTNRVDVRRMLPTRSIVATSVSGAS